MWERDRDMVFRLAASIRKQFFFHTLPLPAGAQDLQPMDPVPEVHAPLVNDAIQSDMERPRFETLQDQQRYYRMMGEFGGLVHNQHSSYLKLKDAMAAYNKCVCSEAGWYCKWGGAAIGAGVDYTAIVMTLSGAGSVESLIAFGISMGNNALMFSVCEQFKTASASSVLDAFGLIPGITGLGFDLLSLGSNTFQIMDALDDSYSNVVRVSPKNIQPRFF